MGAAKKLVDKKALRNLVPLNALSPMHVDEVATKAVIEEVRAGRYIFKQGDRDNQSIYVLNGEVSIIGDDNEVLGGVVGGSDNARHPIGHQQPRQVSARAKTNAVVAYIDSSLLDILLTWDESSGYEVNEIDGGDEDDWMTRMLQSPAFMQLPPSNIQQLLMKMESLPVKAGEVIVRQGDEGDYFYVITNGRCVVTRKATAQGKEVKLAELGDGASFGEDALVSSNKRNATITMLTDGTLMRLAKNDFQLLLQAPLVHQVGYEQAASLAEDGAIWLDVRLPGEFENSAIPGARNIPLSGLRDPSTRLEEDGRYILCCDTGRRSASGAFVLSQRGLDVYVLEGGLQSVPASVLVRADGSPAHAVSSSASAPVVSLEADAEVAPAAGGDADERLRDLKARYDKEAERIREFQESARQTIQAAQQARKAAEEQVAGLQAQLQEAQKALVDVEAQAQAAGGAEHGRVQALEAQLERAAQAQEQLRGELHDAQEAHTEAEARLKQYEQQLGEVRETARRELAETRAEFDAGRQQIADLEQEQGQLQAQLQQLRGELEAAQGDREGRLRQLSGELDGVRTELDQAQTALKTAEQARVELASQQQAIQQERDALQARLATAQQEARSEQGDAHKRMESLEADLLQLRKDHEELGVRASQMAAERDASLQQVTSLQQEQAGLRQRLDELLASTGQEREALLGERDAAREGHERAQARVAELEKSLQGGSQELADLQARIGKYQEQLREQQEAASTASAEAVAREAALQAGLAEAQQTLAGLQAELAERETRHQELEAALQAGAAEQDSQQRALDELRAQLAERDAGAQQLEQQLEAIRGRETGLQAELETVRQAGESALVEAREQVESARQALGQEKDTLQQDLERLRGELAASHKALEERQAQLDGLEQGRRDAEAALAAVAAERTGLETGLREELATLERALEAAQRQAAEAATVHAGQLEEREQALSQQIGQMQAELASAQDARQALQQELEALRQQDASQQAQLQEQQARQQQEIARLEAELASLKGGEADLDAERQRLQRELETAGEQLAAAREQGAALREELQATQARYTEQEQVQTQQLESLQAELDALRAEQAAALDSDTTAGAEVQALNRKLEEQEALVTSIRAELVELTENRDEERSRLQEQLNAARTSLESTQVELTQLRAENAARPEPATVLAETPEHDARIAMLEEQLEQAHSEAQELRTREMVMHEEIDKLRAETEVAQGLAELHGESGGGQATENLERELVQARQNVQIAVRLRTEAEEGRQRAEMELRRLQEELASQGVDAALQAPVVVVPSLDEPESPEPPAAEVAVAPAPQTFQPQPSVEPARRGGGLLFGALMGLVLGLAGAAVGFYLLQPGTVADQVEPSPGQAEPAAPGSPDTATEMVAQPTPATPTPAPATRQEAAPPPAAPAPEPVRPPVVRSFSDSLADGGRGPRMVELRATEFEMGSGPGSPYFDERPRRTVRLGSYAIAQQEVSFAEYDHFARATGRAVPDDMGWGRGKQPVIRVSWNDAVAYTKWLSQQTGQRYRLPTEAEWEYAARAGQEERYWWGNDTGSGRANCHGCGSRWDGQRPAPAGSFAANPFGLQDMNGNVQEWVQDCYLDSYQDAPVDGRAVETAACTQRVVRGGGYASVPDSLRSASRNKLAPDSRLDHVGFRVVRGR